MAYEQYQAYQKVAMHSEVEQASPHRLIQMLLDGAIERVNVIKGAITQNNLAMKSDYVKKLSAIIGGLQSSLDMSQGEISENLRDLYIYMQQELLLAHSENSIERLDNILEILKTIKSGWDGISPAASDAK